jgi:tRNA dimethylallyltransferase
MITNNPKPLIVIVGPTAVGKTEISIKLATHFNGEIVSADSRLFYKGMDIGTAKPTQDEMEGVPHHLIDVSEPDDVWSLARYLPKAFATIDQIHQRGRLPFLVGGTGQYINAVVEGWDLPGGKPDPKLRKILNTWAEEVGVDGIRVRLTHLDPRAAENIDGPNLRRMIRALEVIFTTGYPFSSQRKKKGTNYSVLMIGLTRTREELYQRIDHRIDQMVERGLEQEVQALLDAGYSPELSSMSAIGYKQMVSFLVGKVSLEDAIQQIRSKTRQYVRQQGNWFNLNDPKIHWFDVSEDVFEGILSKIQHFL